MSGGILKYAGRADLGERTVDVCIIGSGCGGATAARVLAEAGREVLVLEEGEDYTGMDFTQRAPEMYDQLYMDRGARATEDMGIQVLQGRVLGGGGVINASDVVPIPEGVLSFWQDKHGLSELSPEKFRPYTEKALEDLSANEPHENQVNRNNRLLREGAEKLGLRGEVMRHNRRNCAGIGVCMLGCPIEAKRNPRNVAIPGAIAAGAEFATRVRAVKIENADGELKTIHARTLDARGYHETGAWNIRAKTLILAANAVASTQLLLRSGVGNANVGRHLSLQPQLPFVAQYPTMVGGYAGIPQLYAVTEFEEDDNPEHGLWGFRIESVFGVPGVAASSLPATGHQGKGSMMQYAKFASALLLVPDDPTGSISVDKHGRPVIHYLHHDNHKARLRQAVKEAAKCYLASGAEVVSPAALPILEIKSEKEIGRVDDLDFAPLTASLISAHQQGGVRMAHSQKLGACDPSGQVYGTRGVFVFDSSWFPSSASSHTMTPIIAASYYLSDRWLAEHST